MKKLYVRYHSYHYDNYGSDNGIGSEIELDDNAPITYESIKKKLEEYPNESIGEIYS